MLHYHPVGIPALIALAIGGLVFIGTLIAARGRSAAAPKVADARRDRRSILWIIVQGIGIGIAGFGPIAVISPAPPAEYVRAAIVLLLMLAAVGLFDWSSRAMGKNWALVARTRDDATLVTTGPFAIVRNPIYVALGLFMVAMSIAYGHEANLVLAIPVYAVGTAMRIVAEERVLRAEFGAAYDAYAARVKRFIPGII